MSVVVVGLNQGTVSLDLLERMAVPDSRLPKALSDVAERDFIREAVILSTCHRTEIYVYAERFHGAVQDIRHFLGALAFAPPEEFSDHLYAYYDDAAVTHLFEVAAGLDSVMPGESEILGQVRNAWERARLEGAAGSHLSALFRHALEVGKRARSETAIARGTTSLANAAVEMAAHTLGSLEGRSVLVLGAGAVGERMAQAVHDKGAGDVAVANRGRERAEAVAQKVGGRVVGLSELPSALSSVDVVLTSTGSPTTVVEVADVVYAVEGRQNRELVIVDLAMPRDVDPAVRELAGVTLFDLADLGSFVDAGVDSRRQEMVKVARIVAEEVNRHAERASVRQVAPTVAALHQKAEQLRRTETVRLRSHLEGLDDRQVLAVDALVNGIIGKLLHEPTVRLKESAGTPRGERLGDAIRELFDL